MKKRSEAVSLLLLRMEQIQIADVLCYKRSVQGFSVFFFLFNCNDMQIFDVGKHQSLQPNRSFPITGLYGLCSAVISG